MKNEHFSETVSYEISFTLSEEEDLSMEKMDVRSYTYYSALKKVVEIKKKDNGEAILNSIFGKKIRDLNDILEFDPVDFIKKIADYEKKKEAYSDIIPGSVVVQKCDHGIERPFIVTDIRYTDNGDALIFGYPIHENMLKNPDIVKQGTYVSCEFLKVLGDVENGN